jgi:hypothetical protein
MKTYAVVKHEDKWGICISGSYTLIFDSYEDALDTAMTAAETLRGANKRATRVLDTAASGPHQATAAPITNAPVAGSQASGIA